MSKPGRKRCERREFYRVKFALTPRQAKHLCTWMLDTLDACKSDEARRLLLGVSEQQETE